MKDYIKNELAHVDKLDTLEELIKLAIRINKRLYKRQLERKGFGEQYIEQGRKDISWKQDYWLQPIELDTMTHKKFPNSTKEMEQHKKEKLYYTYRKLGHIVREHYKKPTNRNRRKKT